MPGTNYYTVGCNISRKDTQISIFKILQAKYGMSEHKNGKRNTWTSIFLDYVLNQHHVIGHYSGFYSCSLFFEKASIIIATYGQKHCTNSSVKLYYLACTTVILRQ